MRKITIALLYLCFLSNLVSAQNPTDSSDASLIDKLKGLKKASMGDLDPTKPIKLTDSTPIYFENGTVVNKNEIQAIFDKHEYMPEIYLNDLNECRAMVLKKMTSNSALQSFSKTKAAPKIKIGDTAPNFSFEDINGKKYTTTDLKGKIVVLNFWFIECKPCVKEMPELNKLVEKYKGKDVVFLGLAINETEKVKAFLKTQPFNYNQIANALTNGGTIFKVNAYPTHIVIDRDNKIALSQSGLGEKTISNLENCINELLK